MTIEDVLSFAGGRWRKWVTDAGGVRYHTERMGWRTGKDGWNYFSSKNGVKSDRAVQKAALAEYHSLMAAIAAVNTPPPAEVHPATAERFRKKAAWHRSKGDFAEAARMDAAAVTPPEHPKEHQFASNAPGSPMAAVWHDRLVTMTAEATGPTLGQCVKSFLDTKALQIGTPRNSVGNWRNLSDRLAFMIEVIGDSLPMASFDHKAMTEVANKAREKFSTNDALGTVRRFIKWAYSEGLLPALPRNLENPDHRQTTIPKNVETMTPETFRKLLEVASPRMRLYLLLAANCGMTQQDISDIAPHEFDPKAGTITRKRSKMVSKAATRQELESVPVVCYKLWPETLTALKAFAKPFTVTRQHGKETITTRHLIPNEKGIEIVHERRNAETGKTHKTDSVNLGLSHLYSGKRARGIERHGFSVIRATSNSLMENAEDCPDAVDTHRFILGRAPFGVDEKHYKKVAFPRFHAALEWLRRQYLG